MGNVTRVDPGYTLFRVLRGCRSGSRESGVSQGESPTIYCAMLFC